jgi:hypothetical protein
VDRMLKEELSLIDMHMFSIKIQMDTIFQSTTSCHKVQSEISLHQIPIYLNLPFQDLSLVIHKLTQTLLLSGKHNSVISAMEHK